MRNQHIVAEIRSIKDIPSLRMLRKEIDDHIDMLQRFSSHRPNKRYVGEVVCFRTKRGATVEGEIKKFTGSSASVLTKNGLYEVLQGLLQPVEQEPGRRTG